MNAYDELLAELRNGEEVEAIIFGKWGWNGFREPKPQPVPEDKRKTVLTLDEARPLMVGWSFDGGYGSPKCYAVAIYTNQRIGWVTQYDGSTRLDWLPRQPVEGYEPDMPGG